MIGFTRGMKQLANAKHERVSGTSKKVMWVFSGTKPTVAQIQALVQANGTILSNSLKALGTLRLSAAYPATTTIQQVNNSLKKWALEERNADFNIHSPGFANWFVFMYVQTTINEPTYTTNANVFQAFIGDAGDIGSGADLEILTGIIESDKIHRTNDVEIRVQ